MNEVGIVLSGLSDARLSQTSYLPELIMNHAHLTKLGRHCPCDISMPLVCVNDVIGCDYEFYQQVAHWKKFSKTVKNNFLVPYRMTSSLIHSN